LNPIFALNLKAKIYIPHIISIPV